MHVLVIPSWYATRKNPVRGSFFREQALALLRGGHRVGVLAIPTRVRTFHGLAELWSLRAHGLQLTSSEDHGLASYRLSSWGLSPSLVVERRLDVVVEAFDRYVAQQGRVDIVHAHSALYAGFAALSIRERRGVPLVLTEHLTAIARDRLFPDQRRRVARAIAGADRCIAVSGALARGMRRIVPGAQVDVLGNVVDTDFFSPPTAPPSRSPFALAIVCSLQRRKGVDVLLRAFQRAFANEQVVLRIAGHGPERGDLEALARRLGVADRVEFLGPLSRERVRELLQRSHALASASYLETFGVTVIEALACGLPVVATRSGGPEEIVTPESGAIVEPGDVPALAAALADVYRSYERFDRSAIRADCVARYGEAAIRGRLQSIYAELLGSAAGP